MGLIRKSNDTVAGADRWSGLNPRLAPKSQGFTSYKFAWTGEKGNGCTRRP